MTCGFCSQRSQRFWGCNHCCHPPPAPAKSAGSPLHFPSSTEDPAVLRHPAKTAYFFDCPGPIVFWARKIIEWFQFSYPAEKLWHALCPHVARKTQQRIHYTGFFMGSFVIKKTPNRHWPMATLAKETIKKLTFTKFCFLALDLTCMQISRKEWT